MAFALVDLYKNFDEATNTKEVFNLISKHENLIQADSIDDFEKKSMKHMFVSFRRENAYVPGNTSVLINIPWVFGPNDDIIKSIQFIKGFTSLNEIVIKNYKTGISVFGVSNINAMGTGILSIKYNNKDDQHVFGDQKIRNGSDVLTLGLAFSSLLKVKHINLGDVATVFCDDYTFAPLRLTLMKKLQGKLGFYEKFGFVMDSSLDVPLLTIRNSSVGDIATILKEKWANDETVEEYVKRIDQKNSPNRIDYCTRLSSILEQIANFNLPCMGYDDKITQLCEAIKYVKNNISHQEKKMTPNDFFSAYKYFK